jgi:hypothetical protein
VGGRLAHQNGARAGGAGADRAPVRGGRRLDADGQLQGVVGLGGGPLQEKLRVAWASGCSGRPGLPTDGKLRCRSCAVARGGSGHGSSAVQTDGEKERGSGGAQVLARVEKRRRKEETWGSEYEGGGGRAVRGGHAARRGGSPGTAASGHTRGRQGKREKGESEALMSGPALDGGASCREREEGREGDKWGTGR